MVALVDVVVQDDRGRVGTASHPQDGGAPGRSVASAVVHEVVSAYTLEEPL